MDKPIIKPFLDEHFLLNTETAKRLYHDIARDLPIIDYHCHLPPKDIADDRRFENLTKIWLDGDHYKWRAMRANGVDERFITGNAGDFEKFEKWAETVPFCMRNPLYHWTHLELRRYFGIEKLLNPDSAKAIYETCSNMLDKEEYSCRNILRKMSVEALCTTDDPTDSLEHHRKIKGDGFDVKVLPAFRPDNAVFIQKEDFGHYIQKLERASGIAIGNFWDLLDALQERVSFFHQNGCRLSDHGLEQLYALEFSDREVDRIFRRRLDGQDIFPAEILQYQSALLYNLSCMYHQKGWVQQFHLGALRNNNSRMLRLLGPDAGFDSIGDFEQAKRIARFLDRLDSENRLTKTILYNLNPRDNEVMASMIGNFNDGSIAGKMQFGSAWWFLDQKDGMERQLSALSNMGLLSRFIGMLTDSRSFLSYPRHEYFRRLLCRLFGKDVENGELPDDMEWIGKLVADICYYNAKNYFSL